MAHALPPAYQRLQRERTRTNSTAASHAGNRRSSTLLFADTFTIPLSGPWANETVYVLDGPTNGGVPSRVRITVDPRAGSIGVVDYADVQVGRQRRAHPGRQIVLEELTSLDNVRPAYWVVFRWATGKGDVRLEHLCFVVHEGTGYRIATSFRKTVRALVEPRLIRMIRSFDPHFPFCDRL